MMYDSKCDKCLETMMLKILMKEKQEGRKKKRKMIDEWWIRLGSVGWVLIWWLRACTCRHQTDTAPPPLAPCRRFAGCAQAFYFVTFGPLGVRPQPLPPATCAHTPLHHTLHTHTHCTHPSSLGDHYHSPHTISHTP